MLDATWFSCADKIAEDSLWLGKSFHRKSECVCVCLSVVCLSVCVCNMAKFGIDIGDTT